MKTLANGIASKQLCDPDEVAETFRRIVDGVTEIRALNATVRGDRRQQTYSGYFDDPEKAAEAVAALTSATGIYFIPNAVEPSLISRAYNRFRPTPRGESTADTNITRR